MSKDAYFATEMAAQLHQAFGYDIIFLTTGKGNLFDSEKTTPKAKLQFDKKTLQKIERVCDLFKDFLINAIIEFRKQQ
jgi:hypothetical protein